MSDSTRYYKLAAVVDNYLVEADLPNGWFNKCLLWAIRGLRELHLDSWADVKTGLFSVTDRNTVELPADFVDWVKISRKGNRIETLGVNMDISTIRESVSRGSITDVGYYLNNFANGAIFSYGLALSSMGSFRVYDNGTCKELLIDMTGRVNELYIEYITDGFDPCGETYIHPYLYDYLTKYIAHKYEEQNNPKATEASIYRKSQDVFYAEKKVRARRNNLDPQTLLNLVRQHTTLALKV